MKKFLILFLLLISAFAFASEDEDYFVACKAYSDTFYDASLKLFTDFVEKYPQSQKKAQAKLFIAKSLFQKNDFQHALELLTEMSAQPEFESFQDEILYFLAQIDIKAKKFTAAQEKLENFIRDYPQSKLYWWGIYALGFCHFENGQFSNAENYFFDVARRSPDTSLQEDAFFNLSAIYYKNSAYDKLTDVISLWFTKIPDTKRQDYVYFYLGEIKYSQKKFLEAVSYYERALANTQEESLKDLVTQSMGWCYLKQNDFVQAEALFRKLRKEEFQLYSFGNLALSTSNFSNAIDYFDNFLKKFPQSQFLYSVYLAKADALYKSGRINDALSLYTFILKNSSQIRDPQIINDAYVGQGWCYLKQSKFEEAVERFQNLAASSDDKVVQMSAQVQAAQVYQDQGKLKEAIELYSEILRKWPQNIYSDYISFQIALCLLKNNDIEAALIAFRALEQNFPSSSLIDDAQYYIALCYYTAEAWDDLRISCESFLRKFPENPLSREVYLLYLDAFAGLGNKKDFMRTAGQIEGLFRSDINFLKRFQVRKALSFVSLGDDLGAIDILRKLVDSPSKEGETPEVFYYLAGIFYKNKDFANAKKYYNALIEKFPDDIYAGDAAYNLAQIAVEERDLALAERILQKLVHSKNEKHSYQSKIALMDLMLQKKDFANAISLGMLMLKKNIQPRNFILYKLGVIYDAMNEYEQAIDYFRRASAEGFNEPELKYFLARDFEQTGRIDDAIKLYFDIIYQENNDYTIRSLIQLGKIYEGKKFYADALVVYRKLQDLQCEESKYAEQKIKELEQKK